MNIPGDLLYSRDHQWIREEADGIARTGITDYAQDALGDVVFVELPAVGASIEAGMVFSEVESSKSLSELHAPLSGEVVAVNDDLEQSPERINDDPYGEGWICEFRVLAPGNLMDADAYRSFVEGH